MLSFFASGCDLSFAQFLDKMAQNHKFHTRNVAFSSRESFLVGDIPHPKSYLSAYTLYSNFVVSFLHLLKMIELLMSSFAPTAILVYLASVAVSFVLGACCCCFGF